MSVKPPLTALILLLLASGTARAQSAVDPATLAKAEAGDAQAEYTVGDAIYGNNDTAHAADAFAWMQKAVAQNLPAATGELGLFYVQGFGTPADPDKGRALLEQANQAGDDLAATNLFALYTNGDGAAFPQDPQKAMSYLTRPVADHDPTAEFDLGLTLEQSGDAADQQKGMPLLEAASAGGNIEASNELGNVYNHGNKVVPASRAKAEPWFRIGAKAGDTSAMTALGDDLILDGNPDGGPGDAEAATWLAKSAATGDAVAETDYGTLLEDGRGLKEDDAAALKYLTQAAAQSNIQAERRLGYLYANGYGTQEDDAKAKSLYQTAAQGGDIIAMRLLGQMELDGTAAGNTAALPLFAKAAAGGDARGEADYAYMIDDGLATKRDPEAALQWDEKAAAKGDDYAQDQIGRTYRFGDGPTMPADPAKAVPWFAKAAAQGNADAQNQLGDQYYLGQGVKQDKAKAGALYAQSAAQQFAAGETNMAECYLDGDCAQKDPPKAVPLLKDAAGQGDVYAENDYGWILGVGLGVNEDDKQAVYWDQKASAAGNAAAARRLGYFTAHGIGTKPDQAAADKLYNTAAAQGDIFAMRFLGEDLMDAGNQDQQALKWLSQAAKAGDATAQVDYGYMLEYGRGTQTDLQGAAHWYKLAALQGHLVGESNLGLLYEYGNGVPRSSATAAHWFEKSAAQGYAVAETDLADYYYDGDGVPKNIARAGQLWQQAAAQQNSNGEANYGLCELEGDCAAKNVAAGFALEKQAALQNDDIAEDVLGDYYLGVYGTTPNKPYALAWYRLAAANGNEHARKRLQDWHFTVPAAPAKTVTATLIGQDVVPVFSGTACAAHGGIGDDSYCSKDGEQINPQTGEALNSNEPGYVDESDVSDDDTAADNGESYGGGGYNPAPAEDYGDGDGGGGGGGGYGGDEGGGGYVDDGGGGGGDSGGDD